MKIVRLNLVQTVLIVSASHGRCQRTSLMSVMCLAEGSQTEENRAVLYTFPLERVSVQVPASVCALSNVYKQLQLLY